VRPPAICREIAFAPRSTLEIGTVKLVPRMFSALFVLLDVAREDAVMVGDSVEDDVKGAVACGARPPGRLRAWSAKASSPRRSATE